MRAKIGRPARPAVVGAAAAPVRGHGRELVDSGAYELLQLSLQVGTNAKKAVCKQRWEIDAFLLD